MRLKLVELTAKNIEAHYGELGNFREQMLQK